MTSRPDSRDDRWRHADDLRGYGDANTGSPTDVSRAWAGLSRRTEKPERPVAEFPLFRLGMVAAAVIVAIVAGLFLLNRPDRQLVAAPQSTPHSLAIAAASSWAIVGQAAHLAPLAVVKADGGRAVALSFGTRAHVTVRSGAEIVVPEGAEPVRVADGVVDFRVTPDPAAPPFRVAADGAVVTVKGTTFSVGLDADIASVEVKEGVVEVAFRAEVVTLRASERWSSAAFRQEAPLPVAPSPAAKPLPASKPPIHDVSKLSPTLPQKVAQPRPNPESDRLAQVLDAWHRRQDPTRCLALADDYLTQFGNGVLSQEVRYLRLLALDALGRDDQFREGFAQFKALSPGSPYLRMLEPIAGKKL